jgi:hypothetical protein
MGETCSTCCTTADEKKNELKEDETLTSQGQARRIQPAAQMGYQNDKQQSLR